MSRDSYDGTLDSPISLNHYHYGASNPILFVDPSGHEDMMSLTYGISVNNILSGVNIKNLVRIVSVLFQLRANKIFAIHVKHSIGAYSVIHEYINLSGINDNFNSYRYDVGSMAPTKALMFQTTEGFIEKSTDISYGHSFVRLSPLQFEKWEFDNYDFGRVPIPPQYGGISAKARKYHLLSDSCWTWTYSSWLSALQIMITIPSL